MTAPFAIVRMELPLGDAPGHAILYDRAVHIPAALDAYLKSLLGPTIVIEGTWREPDAPLALPAPSED